MKTLPTILIAEDDADDRFFLTEAVKETGYPCQLIFAHDGQHALQLLQGMASPPDLVLLDVNMPRLNGFEVLTKIRFSAAWKSLPVLMFSTSNSADSKAKAQTLGADDYLVKPDRIDRLILLWQEVWNRWIQPRP